MSSSPSAAETNYDVENQKILSDIVRCEMFVSLAARTGVPTQLSWLRAIKTARAELRTRESLSPKMEAYFYKEMGNIVAHVPYPNKTVADDLRHGADMVSYAGLSGKPIAIPDIEAVSVARDAQRDFEWSIAVEAPFYDAMSRISRALAPVGAETVGIEAREGTRKALRNYSISAAILTLLILTLSCLLFVVKQISEDIQAGIQTNDQIALTLHGQLQAFDAAIKKESVLPSADSFAQTQTSPQTIAMKNSLQRLATTNRQLYTDIERTRSVTNALLWLPNFIGRRMISLLGKTWGKDWGSVAMQYANVNCSAAGGADWECSSDSRRRALEVDLSADKNSPMIADDAVKQGFQKIAVYQQIRATASWARDTILSFVGSTTGFVLPILYAWLGATAAILRKLHNDIAARTFHPEYSKVANRSHVTNAVIVGVSIGLLSETILGGTLLSPLAIAFAAGYSSDALFQFLDRLVQSSSLPSNYQKNLPTTSVENADSTTIQSKEPSSEFSDPVFEEKAGHMEAFAALKRLSEAKQRQADHVYSRLSVREVIEVRGFNGFAVSVLGVLAIILWAAQLVPGLTASLIASAHAQENRTVNVDKVAGNLKGFVPPLGLSIGVWNGMVVVTFGVLITIALAFLWKGYFAKTKSEKAARFLEHFATLVLGAFFGKGIG